MLSTVDKWVAGAFGLIGLYLVLANSSQFSEIMDGLGKFTNSTFKTLQARDNGISNTGVKINF